MTSEKGLALLKEWGWAILFLITISVGIATVINHSDEEDIHQTTLDQDERYVSKEIFDLTVQNLKEDVAYIRKLLDKIDKKLEE